MSNKYNILSGISPIVRFIAFILIIIGIIIAKSIYLILSISILVLILFMYSNKSINSYISFIKKLIIVFTLLTIISIVITKNYNFLNIFIIDYKVLMIMVIIKILYDNFSFSDIHQTIYMMLFPIKSNEKVSFYIAQSFLIIKFWIDSNSSLKKEKNNRNIYWINFRKSIRYRILYTMCKFKTEELKYKLNFYKIKKEKINMKSKIIFIVFILFFIICVYKEVII